MIIWSLFDYSGSMVEPWEGHTRICIDLQHTEKLPRFINAGETYKVSKDVRELSGIKTIATNAATIAYHSKNWPRPDLIFGFPPCTDLAVSGARWFKDKAKLDPNFQDRAVNLCRQVELLGNMYNCPWMLENPVSRLSTLWRKPDEYFHPWQFSHLCPEDNYTKKTGIWYGNGFVMPKGLSVPVTRPDDRIHKAGPSPERANFRSKTPLGFARAVYMANSPENLDLQKTN